MKRLILFTLLPATIQAWTVYPPFVWFFLTNFPHISLQLIVNTTGLKTSQMNYIKRQICFKFFKAKCIIFMLRLVQNNIRN